MRGNTDYYIPEANSIMPVKDSGEVKLKIVLAGYACDLRLPTVTGAEWEYFKRFLKALRGEN